MFSTQVERAEDRARADRAEDGLLVLAGAAARVLPAALDAAQRGLFRLCTPAEVAADESARRGSVLQQQLEAERTAALEQAGFDVAEEAALFKWSGAPRFPDLRGVLADDVVGDLGRERVFDVPETAADALADAPRNPDARPADLPERVILQWCNHASRNAGRGGAPAAATESMPTFQEMTDWRTAFVDGRQLARIVFAELEACLASRAVKGVERDAARASKGSATLLGAKGVGPKLWKARVDGNRLISFASDVRSRLDRPNDLAALLEAVAREDLGLPPDLLHADDLRRRDVDWHFPLLAHLFCRGGSRLVDHDADVAPDGLVGKYRYAKAELARARGRWARLRADILVPPPPAAGGGGGDDDEGAVPLLPRDALAKLLPPPSALQTDADDPDLDAGVGDLVALAADAAAMIEAVGALEADEWRNSMLWDAARTAVQEKCVAELARRARVVPGPRFQGRLAASPKLAGN